MHHLLTAIKWLDRNAERTMILVAYSLMAGIIVVAVIERFVFRSQIPWSTSIPIYLFLWVTWIGCSYNVKQRTHLTFNELRLRMSYQWQYFCVSLDGILWLVFGAMVTYYTYQQTVLAYNNFAIVQGTDNMMQWWFYLATPVAWILLMFRVLQNMRQDYQRYRLRQPFLIDIQKVDTVQEA
jgi:TRAP-type C4-dicarboxylate transport system permease small subunit